MTRSAIPKMNPPLLIHMGGLGDVCLSESLFLSLSTAFGARPVALGHPRFLRLFTRYFERIDDVGSARWLHLFSGDRPGDPWQQIVFVGKDREGTVRERLRGFSREPLVFIDMYPDAGGPARGAAESAGSRPLHVEEHQLRQLPALGIKPLRATIEPRPADRVILYPEAGFEKRKWPVDRFLALRESLLTRGVAVVLLGQAGLDLPSALFVDEMPDVARFLAAGGLFVSNDSGLAHLAGSLGLATVTIFHEYDPALWHPRGRNRSLRSMETGLPLDAVEAAVLEMLSSDR